MMRAHIFFSGTVQGIGFRYTTQAFAQELQLTGWVKNLPDGRVEILVEGPREVIENLLMKLRNHFDGFIRDQQVDWMDAGEDFDKFSIAH